MIFKQMDGLTNMRCYVCDKDLKEPQFDHQHRALPCPECSAASEEALADFDDDEEFYDEGDYEYEDEDESEDIVY